jgi:hypothetical protein
MPESLTFNVFDQAALTTTVNRPLVTRQEQEPTIGEQIAPLVPVQSRVVKLEVRDVHAFGKGQFRAPGATPPLVDFQSERREEAIELALLDEMHRIKDEDFLALNSPDQNVRRNAGLTILERGNALGIRNRRLTEALRWDAFSGEAVITYPNGSQIEVDYGIPAGNKPTAAVDWSDTVNSDPIADLKAWQKLPANQIGHYATKIHLSTQAFEYVIENENIVEKLTGSDRPLFVPREEDVLALLRNGTQFIITDAGYRDEGVGTARGVNTLTKYLPENVALITTEYVVDGERIADTPDGQVIVSTGYNQVAIRQGAQAEVILEHISKTHFLRYGSARIPRIHQPEAFVYATLW